MFGSIPLGVVNVASTIGAQIEHEADPNRDLKIIAGIVGAGVLIFLLMKGLK